jgi:hypothetical protein
MDHERVIFFIVGVVALLSNALTVMLFIKKSKWLKKVYNCLILALAIQDISIAVCLLVLPGFVMTEDAYKLPCNASSRSIYCKILWSQYIPFALGITSVYTCLMLTFDRWLAVARPLSYKKYQQSIMMVIVTVLFPWIAGFCFEITAPLNATVMEVNGTYLCGWKERKDSSEITTFLAVFTFLGMIIIPATLMVLAYSRIIVQMKQSRKRVSGTMNSINTHESTASRSLKRISVIAFVASMVVIVCWLPDQLYYTLSQVRLTKLGTTEHFAVKTLAFACSCINPAIYCFWNSSYRSGLKEIICCGRIRIFVKKT